MNGTPSAMISIIPPRSDRTSQIVTR